MCPTCWSRPTSMWPYTLSSSVCRPVYRIALSQRSCMRFKSVSHSFRSCATTRACSASSSATKAFVTASGIAACDYTIMLIGYSQRWACKSHLRGGPRCTTRCRFDSADIHTSIQQQWGSSENRRRTRRSTTRGHWRFRHVVLTAHGHG